MDYNAIVELIHNPNFDPSSWMLTAIQSYVAVNPGTLVKDPVARPYLMKGVNCQFDVTGICNAIVQIHNDDKSLAYIALRELVNSCNRSNSLRDHNLFSKLKDHPDLTLRSIVVDAISILHFDPAVKRFFNILDADQKVALLNNWEFTYNYSDFNVLIKEVPNTRLQDILSTTFAKSLDKLDVKTVQDTLDYIGSNMADKYKSSFIEFLKSYVLNNSYMNYSEYRSFVRGKYGFTTEFPVKINEQLGRCGQIIKSKSGYTNHANQCIICKENPNLWLKYANKPRHINECDKCFNQYETKSALTLHMKKCKQVS